MHRYEPVWLEIAEQQYRDLPADLRKLTDQRLDQLLKTRPPTLTRSTTNAPISGVCHSAIKACCSTP
jgi:hypothetical protein